MTKVYKITDNMEKMARETFFSSFAENSTTGNDPKKLLERFRIVHLHIVHNYHNTLLT